MAIMVTRMIDPGAQLRLWQLISPSLPVGAYAYSGGLEAAIEAGWVSNEQQAREWIEDLLTHALAHLDVPVFQRLYEGAQKQDHGQFQYWNDYILASRESAELLQEDRHLGRALLRLIKDLGIHCEVFKAEQHYSYASLFAYASVEWKIPMQEALHGILWSWCENQVAAAIKLVPLGQTAGQQILGHLQQAIPLAVRSGLVLDDAAIGFTMPGLGIVSAHHESQYSRLFRS